ncbi:MAG: Vi polysaccharide biosynthesis protein VipA/TviB [Flavobacteriales bacterium]|nr:Vi polysaccharide biosynthesis protein VipA/TviB [Flavobacteriales bacterium]|tara:strand:+ start:52761 stop:54008 length:1248 start_codon:yes stop_codon:yes gene_type:complete
MTKENKIAIIGLGYVGLPLAIAFSKYYKVIGFDIDSNRVQELNNAVDSNGDISFQINNNIKFTDQEKDLVLPNVYIITVPTPVTANNIPDLSLVENATNMVANYLRKGDLVIYESTVYPGVTEEICVPILEKGSGMKYNVDFYCGYSPERISPGSGKYNLQNVVKITSGSNDDIAHEVDQLYKKVITAGTYKAPSIKVAEAAKVVENTQRDVNIALMNELAMMFDKMHIETTEVLKAAKTKWNFLDFRPGLVGGHCIGVDPYYLLHKSEESGYKPTLLYSSREINNSVASFIVKKTIELMLEAGKIIKGSSILLLGYTFKENCADTRNTKVKDIITRLESVSCNVSVYDPYINATNDNKFILDPLDSDKKYDAIIAAVAHDEFLTYSIDDFCSLSKGKLVFLDLKGIYAESTWKL